MTEQRRIILEELKTCERHPAADDVYIMVKKRLPRISLGTVYRNLELLYEEGMIHMLEYGSGQKRFDPNPRPHCHFRCSVCGRVEDIPFDIGIPQLAGDDPWFEGRRIHRARLEYGGVCPTCEQHSDPKGDDNGRTQSSYIRRKET